MFYAVDYELDTESKEQLRATQTMEVEDPPSLAIESVLKLKPQQSCPDMGEKQKKKKTLLDMKYEPVPVYECLFCSREHLVCQKKIERVLCSKYASVSSPQWASVSFMYGLYSSSLPLSSLPSSTHSSFTSDRSKWSF